MWKYQVLLGPSLVINLFVLEDEHYLVLVDYMSKFPIMRRINNETSPVVIQSIKAILSELIMSKRLYQAMVPVSKVSSSRTLYNLMVLNIPV